MTGNTFPLSFSNGHDDGFAQFLFLQLHTNNPLALAYVRTILMHLTKYSPIIPTTRLYP
jgi:hypothetical protein